MKNPGEEERGLTTGHRGGWEHGAEGMGHRERPTAGDPGSGFRVQGSGFRRNATASAPGNFAPDYSDWGEREGQGSGFRKRVHRPACRQAGLHR